MEFLSTDLPEVLLIKPKLFGDNRGFFMETFRQKEFDERVGVTEFVQDNHSGSPRGVLRGLHYQLKSTQGKLVRVVAGEVFDVAVDIRRGSPDFGKWTGVILSAENKYQLWVPEGFAHGYYVISEWAEFVYKTTDYYDPQWERSLLWNDPEIGIEWPLVNGVALGLSAKDAAAPLLRNAEVFPVGWSKAQKET
ncbi:MAG: dTDP-4-dehydrorhamnose 3,5-epimerase [Chloroflexi bacterium]|nr:dTDP-4-dehydrorhamnose 3,5-epimerase [Chloroflexota bacterium]